MRAKKISGAGYIIYMYNFFLIERERETRNLHPKNEKKKWGGKKGT